MYDTEVNRPPVNNTPRQPSSITIHHQGTMSLQCDFVQAAYPMLRRLFDWYLEPPEPDAAPESASRLSRYYYYTTQIQTAHYFLGTFAIPLGLFLWECVGRGRPMPFRWPGIAIISVLGWVFSTSGTHTRAMCKRNAQQRRDQLANTMKVVPLKQACHFFFKDLVF